MIKIQKLKLTKTVPNLYLVNFAAMELKEALKTISNSLKSGEVILCPTDTIWGLSCDATNADTVNKIIDLKGRDQSKSFIVLVNSYRMINQIFKEIPDVAWDLIDLTEDPLTLVLDDASFVAPNVLNQDGSLGIRMIKSGICFDILNAFNRPMVSTSANFSGQTTPLTFEAIDSEIKSKVDSIFPVELVKQNLGKPSKIIKINRKGEISILRK